MASSWKEPHGQLPGTIDLIQLAERGARLTGTLPLKSMPRLAQGSLDGSGDVRVDLAFELQQGEKVFVMRGTLQAHLRMTCQRCLEAMDLELKAAPWLVLLKSGERQEIDADVLVADKPLLLSGLVEDELLLAMPMVPLHPLDQCATKVRAAKIASAAPAKSGCAGKNPFSVLDQLKKLK